MGSNASDRQQQIRALFDQYIELYASRDERLSSHFSANFSVGAGVTINAHAGKQWIEGNAAFEYTDWKLGATKAFDNGFSVGLAYTGTDADDALYTNPFGNKVADDTVALTITKAF